jgi:Carboxypeptidase regulatory-like domain
MGKIRSGRLWGASLAIWLVAGVASAQQSGQAAAPQGGQATTPKPAPQSEQAAPQATGSVSGRVVDQLGAAIGGARVKLTSKDSAASQETMTDEDGRFVLVNIAPGNFDLTITSAGLTTQTVAVAVHPGEAYAAPQITMMVAPATTQVQVVAPKEEVAEAEVKEEEKQRVFGVIPNFYVSYDPKAASLDTKQKFELAWRTLIDPVTFGLTGAIAGIQQASNQFGGYGQGAEGYGKRYGASYADAVTGTLIGSAILPSILRQDPRYFYKGTGTVKSRVMYAIANAVICKGDNGRWQPNYSAILGNMAAGGISNLYYPREDRNGIGLTFENAAIGIGAAAGANLLQEFLIPKLTPNFAKRNASAAAAAAAKQ